MEVQHHSFLILAPGGGDWSAEQSSRFTLKDIAPKYPLNGRLIGPPSWSGYFGQEKNILFLLEFKPWIVEPIT